MFAQFLKPGDPQQRLGFVVANQLVDLSIAAPTLPRDLLALINLGQSAMDSAAQAAKSATASAHLALNAVHWLMPISKPGKIICLGLNYVEHAKEGGNAPPTYPSFFLRVNSSLMAHEAAMVRPKVSDKLDYEAELAVIIGKRARHLTPENALQAVAGYSCFNDGSLRDYQRKTTQWTIGKNFDATGAFGPGMVPASALPPGAAGLHIESRLNGKVMQSDNTGNKMFPVIQTLCWLSEVMTLEPGDVIAMGTPSGVGYARTPPVFMKAGDRIEVEIEGIGILANTVADEA
jgi:acylpyruvate hydrolase